MQPTPLFSSPYHVRPHRSTTNQTYLHTPTQDYKHTPSLRSHGGLKNGNGCFLNLVTQTRYCVRPGRPWYIYHTEPHP
ncbi:uncharacterized protein UV8b_05370 [Ustilaginoidea virens]|uniref:Uncharacterized protein n=1 Tax=Ustilaginoidea virens TaxID=1159556 RepID=A0A8E5MJ06_USTVR|nr:uncharacterized protein UV8b_05370 [Ustilaginoidea virens]QUC21127.1 hypothetical protein UV8b_05370 [Ustilaginoidea virens]